MDLRNISILVLLFVGVASFGVTAQELEIIASGELHGTISSCNCPDDPGGGIAGISYVVQDRQKENPVLLFDGGGFSAGGIYDLYTTGKKTDSIKTLHVLDAMGRAGYDAVAVGDEELQYDTKWLKNAANKNGVQLLSANILDKDSNFVFTPYKIISKSNRNFLVTALTTNENFLIQPDDVFISDPINALNNVLKIVNEEWDTFIILSHLGEDISRLIYENDNPFLTVVINSHKKKSTEVGAHKGKTALMQFGFLGKKVSYLKLNDNEFKSIGWYDNNMPQNQDNSIVNLSETYLDNVKNIKKDIYDLYLMSMCPYGLPVLNDLNHLFASLKNDAELNLWFIGDVDSLKNFRSLHGQDEIDEELLWLAVKNIYPEYNHVFLTLVASGEFTTKETISELGLDIIKLNNWIKKKGLKELETHYNRSNKLFIDASPTLILNNKPFQGEMSSDFIRARQCSENGKEILKCDSLPECFIDSDCIKPKNLGFCLRDVDHWGKCEYKKDEPFIFTVITSNKIVFKVEEDLISTTKEMFPAVEIKKIDYQSKEAKKILKDFNVSEIPFVKFSDNLSKTYNFNKIKEGLIKTSNGFTFREDYVKGTYYLEREEKIGEIKLFYNREALPKSILLKVKKILNLKNSAKVCQFFLDTNSNHIYSFGELSKKQINLLEKDLKDSENVKPIFENYMIDVKDFNINSTPLFIVLDNRELVLPQNENEINAVLDKMLSLVK